MFHEKVRMVHPFVLDLAQRLTPTGTRGSEPEGPRPLAVRLQQEVRNAIDFVQGQGHPVAGHWQGQGQGRVPTVPADARRPSVQLRMKPEPLNPKVCEAFSSKVMGAKHSFQILRSSLDKLTSEM